MNELTLLLVQLQALETGRAPEAGAEAQTSEIRSKLPEQILAHYDRLRARGKKGLAPVRNQTCGACHMQVRLATIMTLKRGDDIQLCDNCGRYLYLCEQPVTDSTDAPPAVRPKRARRKRAAAAAPTVG